MGKIIKHRWMKGAVGLVIVLAIVLYAGLGPLRFFANHFWGIAAGHKEYLILLQNNDELRPGGGFITAYANLNLLFGIPTRLDVHNAYDIETEAYVLPPYPHEELLKNEWYRGYTFRDANWDPDFPEAVETLLDFYNKKNPHADLDGIFVINFSVIEDLVERLGRIKINDKKINNKALFKELEFAVNNVDRHNVEALGARKEILGQLAKQLTRKIVWHPFKTADVMSEAIGRKNLYFWFNNSRLQNKGVLKGWANDLFLPEDSDFIHINFANLGAKKADRYVLKNAEYYIDMSRPVPVAHLKVALSFPGKKNAYSDPYRGYLRVYLPRGAVLTHTPPNSRVDKVGAFRVIGTIIDVPDNSGVEWTYDYTLPRGLLAKDEYRLRLHKQSADTTRYLVVVTAQNDAELQSKDFDIRENKAYFQGQLKGDTDLALRVGPDATPPYLLEQKFEKLNEIILFWSEEVRESAPENYTMSDRNVTDPKTDTVSINRVTTDGNTTHLFLAGVTGQPLEQYRIELKNVRDKAGNATLPDPKEVTAVQRF